MLHAERVADLVRHELEAAPQRLGPRGLVVLLAPEGREVARERVDADAPAQSVVRLSRLTWD